MRNMLTVCIVNGQVGTGTELCKELASVSHLANSLWLFRTSHTVTVGSIAVSASTSSRSGLQILCMTSFKIATFFAPIKRSISNFVWHLVSVNHSFPERHGSFITILRIAGCTLKTSSTPMYPTHWAFQIQVVVSCRKEWHTVPTIFAIATSIIGHFCRYPVSERNATPSMHSNVVVFELAGSQDSCACSSFGTSSTSLD